MNSRLQLVDIRIIWDRIKPYIQDLRDRYGMDWRPEDVYARCMAGTSFCWVCKDGFLIVSPRENVFTLRKELFVWICVGWSGEDLIDEYFDDIREVARDVGATAILFESPREGFRRIAQKRQWPSMTTYTLGVA